MSVYSYILRAVVTPWDSERQEAGEGRVQVGQHTYGDARNLFLIILQMILQIILQIFLPACVCIPLRIARNR